MTSTNPSRTESDAVSTFRWGLRRYALLVVACMIALGAVFPMVLSLATPERYEAQAQVGPVSELKLQNLDPLPRLGETVFRNGAVAAAVRQSFDPPLPETDPIVPDRVELVAPQDNVVFTVVGRGATASEAKDVANVAAGTLTDELNRYDEAVGPFGVQRIATAPARPVSSVGGLPAVAGGLLAGLLLGVGLVAALLAWRRPVIDATAAARAAGAPVITTLQLTRSQEFRGLSQLCHHLLHSSVDAVFLTGPGSGSGQSDRRRLAMQLRSLLTGPRAVTILRGDTGPRKRPQEERKGSGSHASELLIVEEPTQAQLATRPANSLTLLVVPVGISEARLRRYVESYLDSDGAGVVLVRRSLRLGNPLPRAGRRGSGDDTLKAA